MTGGGEPAGDIRRHPRCRGCGAALSRLVVDLGSQPLANSFVDPARAGEPDPTYPLRAFVCESCWLVQLQDFTAREVIFNDEYAYFASYSDSWLRHAASYVDLICDRLPLGPDSFVVELASNDGYLLRNFLPRGIPVLGVEPSGNTAAAAEEQGIPTLVAFFGRGLAEGLVAERGSADLVIANNVLAHVPDLNDFIAGIAVLLDRDGTATIECPHLVSLIEHREFDTIYHEHFSYFSLGSASAAFARHGLEVVDVELLPSHGGSLRLFVRHAGTASPSPAVEEVAALESRAGLTTMSTYEAFAADVERVRDELLAFLADARAAGRSVVAYGAPAKGNTLLNYCGITTADVPFTVDRSPYKQGLLLPGSRLPIREPAALLEARPDHVLVLPWNLFAEITEQLAEIRSWGGTFVRPVPRLVVR